MAQTIWVTGFGQTMGGARWEAPKPAGLSVLLPADETDGLANYEVYRLNSAPRCPCH